MKPWKHPLATFSVLLIAALLVAREINNGDVMVRNEAMLAQIWPLKLAESAETGVQDGVLSLASALPRRHRPAYVRQP